MHYVQVFDYIVNAVKRTGPSIEITDDEDMATREDFSSWEWLVLNVCEVWLVCSLDSTIQFRPVCLDHNYRNCCLSVSQNTCMKRSWTAASPPED